MIYKLMNLEDKLVSWRLPIMSYLSKYKVIHKMIEITKGIMITKNNW